MCQQPESWHETNKITSAYIVRFPVTKKMSTCMYMYYVNVFKI